MSERVERRLLELLDGPVTSPYGNAIPGLAELGMQVPPPAPSGISVVDALADDVSSVTLVRIGENPQAAPAVLEALVGIGLVPGTMLALSRDGDRYEVATSTGAVSLDESTARHLFVAPEATRH
jgi:DtxR family Mn-dependent transcriptional regulator